MGSHAVGPSRLVRAVAPAAAAAGLSVVLVLITLGCVAPVETGTDAATTGEPDAPALELVSPLLGVTLLPTASTSEDIEAAEAALADAPDDVETLLSAGRAYAGVWRYTAAIAVYDRAVDLAPEDWRPYRHRGHRYISTRRFDEAIGDLERARDIEPHGFDIAYHLGLAYYLAGRFSDAADEYGRCMALADDAEAIARVESGQVPEGFRSCVDMRDDPGDLVAVSEWRWRALARAGRGDEAAGLLEPIRPHVNVGDNLSYLKTLLVHGGRLSVEEALDPDTLDDNDFVTVGYGVAVQRLVEDDVAGARELLERIVDDAHWNGFGYIAAESDLVHLNEDGR